MFRSQFYYFWGVNWQVQSLGNTGETNLEDWGCRVCFWTGDELRLLNFLICFLIRSAQVISQCSRWVYISSSLAPGGDSARCQTEALCVCMTHVGPRMMNVTHKSAHKQQADGRICISPPPFFVVCLRARTHTSGLQPSQFKLLLSTSKLRGETLRIVLPSSTLSKSSVSLCERCISIKNNQTWITFSCPTHLAYK